MKEVFPECEVERHFLREVLAVVDVGLCDRVGLRTSLRAAAESQLSNHVPALMESDGSETGSTEGSIGSV